MKNQFRRSGDQLWIPNSGREVEVGLERPFLAPRNGFSLARPKPSKQEPALAPSGHTDGVSRSQLRAQMGGDG